MGHPRREFIRLNNKVGVRYGRYGGHPPDPPTYQRNLPVPLSAD